MKQKNPRMGCPQIAAQISHAFGINIDKDVVRRVLDKHYKPSPSTNGASWLTFLAQMKDSLWSVDFFHTESINLRTYVVMVVMDIFTRRIFGFAVRPYPISGPDACATLFWNQYDLQRKLDSFKDYYYQHRVHSSLGHQTPHEKSEICTNQFAELKNFKLKLHCNGLFHTPIPA